MSRFFSIPRAQSHGGHYCGGDGRLRLKSATQEAAESELAEWLRNNPQAEPTAELFRAFELDPPAPGGSFSERAERDYDRLATRLDGVAVGAVTLPAYA